MMTKINKLLVLDMDGSGANSDQLIEKWIKDHEKKYGREKSVEMFKEEFNFSKELIFPEIAKRVNNIVDKTGCKILWSSTWRLLPEYKDIKDAIDMFNRRGLPGDALIGYTPDLGRMSLRGDEIRMWLYNNKYGPIDYFKRVAVLDDIDDAGMNLPDNCMFFRTKEYSGLTDRIMKNIIEYLNG